MGKIKKLIRKYERVFIDGGASLIISGALFNIPLVGIFGCVVCIMYIVVL